MLDMRRPVIVKYAVAVAAVIVVTILKLFLVNLFVGDQQWFLLYVAAICISSWYGGFGPGAVTAILSALSSFVFFANPGGFDISTPSHIFQLLLFLLEGLLVVGFTGNLREARAEAQESDEAKDEALALLETFQVYAPVGLAFLDNDLRYLRINYAMAELDGLTPAAHIGRTIQDVDPQIKPELLAAIRQVAETGKPLLDYEQVIVRPTMLGMKKQYLLTSYYRIRGADGEPLGVGAVMVDMSEHRQAEEALRESEARFRTMADTAPVMIRVQDANMDATYVNKVWLDHTGRTLEQELGKGWQANIHPEDLPRFIGHYTAAINARQDYEFEYRLRRYDGEYRWVLSKGVPRFTPEGVYVGYIGTSMDITDRKQQEIAQQFIVQSGVILASSLDYETTLTNVARLAVPSIADWCAVDLLTKEGGVERVTVAHVDPEKVKWAYELQERYPIDMNAPAGLPNVLRTGTTEFIPEVTEAMIEGAATDAEMYQIIRDIGFTSVIIAPMIARGRTIGALTLVTTESRRHYAEADVRQVELLATRAALAVDNSRLYAEARAERERFRVTLSSIGDAVIATDNQGQVTFMNRIASNLTGYSEQESLGKPLNSIFNIVNEHSRDLVENPVDKVIREGRIVGLANHTVLISKSGTETPIDDSGAPIPDDTGEVGGVVLVFRDVSERKRTERRQQFLAEASQQLIASLDYETTLQQVTQLAVPTLADWCAVYLRQANGDIREVARTASDPQWVEVRNELMERFPLPLSQSYGYPYVIRTGESQLLGVVSDDILQAAAQNEEHLQLLRRSSYQSSICVPLKNSAGTFGAITLSTLTGGRTLNNDDLVYAEELGRVASLAVENARLYRQAMNNENDEATGH